MTGHIGGLVTLLEKEAACGLRYPARVVPRTSVRSCGQGCHQDCKLWLVLQGGPCFLCPLAVPTEPDMGHGGIKMPQGHHSVGSIWKDYRMVPPASLPAAEVRRGKETSPVSISSLVWIMCAAVAPLFKSLQLTFSNQGFTATSTKKLPVVVIFSYLVG
jgi:hypothetical protein